MPSDKTLLPSPSTTQTENPSARLSLAIFKLDQLIIRVGNIGTLTDRSFLETPRIQLVPKETDSPDLVWSKNSSSL